MMLKLIPIAVIALVLSGCASFNQLNSEVSTYGPWPAERKPASYAFERLPSEQAQPQRRQVLEDAARVAVEAAGFRPAADPKNAEYLMQVGARVTSNEPWVYNDPLFWRFGARYGFSHGYGPWRRGWGPGWGGGFGYGFGYDGSTSFEREVALLIRDARTGALLYEARANNTGPSPSIEALLPAMFTAAMQGFPGAGPNPRKVTVQLSQR